MTLRVVKMDIKNRRLGLSLKKVNSAEYLDQDWGAYAVEPGDEGEFVESETTPDEETGANEATTEE
jgi:hypothetical protein